jgi:hypothetical protein
MSILCRGKMRRLAGLAVLALVLLTSSCQFVTGGSPQTPGLASSAPGTATAIPALKQLTDTEKAKVVDVALNSPEAVAWLQGRTDYRLGEVEWYAIVFEDGRASSWSIVHPGSTSNGLPPPLATQPVSYYPGITIAVGAGTIYQMQIAVNLETGKAVMVDGPYPSLASPDRFKNLTSTPSTPPAISKQQAIAIASKTLRSSLVDRAVITAEFHVWYWEVSFDNLNAKAEELVPWPLKNPPPASPGQPTVDPYSGIYQSVFITVDAQTGMLKSAGARHAPEPVPYVNRDLAVRSATEMMVQTTANVNWGVDATWFKNAGTEAYLRGDTWIVLFWDDASPDHRFSVTVNAVTGKASGGGRG